MEEFEKNDGEKVDRRMKRKKSATVKIKCTIPSGWTIPDPQLGTRRIVENEEVEFDIFNRQELHCLIQVLKTLNTPRINEVEYKKSPTRHGIRKKFEIVEGLEQLPTSLQKIKFGPYKYTPEEMKAIVLLVPEFFQKKTEIIYKMQK